jgi:hypothetical protein
MTNNPGIQVPRHPDGYAEVISIEQLHDCLRYSLITCRHKDASRMHRCAHAAVHAMLCPCAWNEDCIVNAVESELLNGSFVMTQPECDGLKNALTPQVVETTRRSSTNAVPTQRNERLDAALDEALAATFPASDPVALSYRWV